MRIVKHYFNMVEVALAMAVVGLGIAGIMSLFPVGLNASKEAIGDNYSSDTADFFITYISANCNDETKKYDSNTLDFWDHHIYDTTADVDGNEAISDNKPTAADESGATFSSITGDNIGLYKCDSCPSTKTAQLYRVKQGNDNIVDFHATIRIWKTPIKNLYIAGKNQGSLPYKYGTGLNIEVSWPAEVNYDVRENKRLYYVEIFNTNL